MVKRLFLNNVFRAHFILPSLYKAEIYVSGKYVVPNNLNMEIYNGLTKNFLNKNATEEVFYTRNRVSPIFRCVYAYRIEARLRYVF